MKEFAPRWIVKSMGSGAVLFRSGGSTFQHVRPLVQEDTPVGAPTCPVTLAGNWVGLQTQIRQPSLARVDPAASRSRIVTIAFPQCRAAYAAASRLLGNVSRLLPATPQATTRNSPRLPIPPRQGNYHPWNPGGALGADQQLVLVPLVHYVQV